MHYSLVSYQLTPHTICNYQGTDGTSINKQVQSLCSPLYRARNLVGYNSITALELKLSKQGYAFFILYVALLFQLADRANRVSEYLSDYLLICQSA
jgi:hypothetical protein